MTAHELELTAESAEWPGAPEGWKPPADDEDRITILTSQAIHPGHGLPVIRTHLWKNTRTPEFIDVIAVRDYQGRRELLVRYLAARGNAEDWDLRRVHRVCAPEPGKRITTRMSRHADRAWLLEAAHEARRIWPEELDAPRPGPPAAAPPE